MIRLSTPRLLARILATLLAVGLLVLGVMMSLIVLASAVVIGAVVLGYLWWKSRAARKLLREAESTFRRNNTQPGGNNSRIIEGEAHVVNETPDRR